MTTGARLKYYPDTNARVPELISIIVPVYNEASTVAAVIERLQIGRAHV
jgi:hypothetical protein